MGRYKWWWNEWDDQKCKCKKDVWYTSPVILDLYGLGEPDLLAGPEWKKPRPPARIGGTTRLFDLDGTGAKQWEWVGPKAGLLVYGKTRPTKVDGTVLFGTHTGGQEWDNGYQPLANLDSDKSGAVEGDELKELWVWLDADSDASVGSGEMTPAAQWVRKISVKPEVDIEGNAWTPNGVTLKDGKQVASWDWWSCAENPLYRSAKQTGYGEYAPMIVGAKRDEKPVIYEWKMDGDDQGGFLRFFNVDKDLYVVCSLRGVDPDVITVKFAKVKVSDGKMQWAFSSGANPVSDSQAVEGVLGGVLRGEGTISQSGGTLLDKYRWSAVPAKLAPGYAGYRLLTNISSEQFARGVKQKGRTSENLFLSTGYGPGYTTVDSTSALNAMRKAENARLEQRWKDLRGKMKPTQLAPKISSQTASKTQGAEPAAETKPVGAASSKTTTGCTPVDCPDCCTMIQSPGPGPCPCVPTACTSVSVSTAIFGCGG